MQLVGYLDRELELLALEDLGVVDVEEVTIQDSLNNAGNDGDPISLVVGVHEISVDPVRNVQGSVATQSEQVVRCDGFGLASSLKHEELGKNGHRLQPDGKGPHDFGKGVLVREQNGQHSGASEEVLDAEGVDVGIVCRLVGVGHEVDDVSLGSDEHDFKGQVV